MQAIHKTAIKTGITGGIAVIAILVIIDALIIFYLGFFANDLSAIEDQFPFLYFLPVLACIIAMTGVGAIAVCRASVIGDSDVAAVSLLAGAVASVIASLVNVMASMATTYLAFWILFPGATGTPFDAYVRLFSETDSLLGLSVLCCSLPVSIFMGTIVAFFGGIIYARLQPGKASPSAP